MSNQGAPAQHRPDDGWWHTVYAGPAGTLPDAADGSVAEGSVDDWFDSAVGMIGPQRAASPITDQSADEVGVDEWFDSAVQMIGAQRAELPEPEPEPELDRTTEPGVPGVPGEAAESVPDQSADEVGVDDWFDSAARMIDPQRAELPELELESPAEAEDAPAAQVAPEITETPAVVAEAAPPPDPTPRTSPPPPTPSPAADEATSESPSPRRPYRQEPVPHVGERPPTYGPEPTALPAADPDELGVLVPDTALEGAQYGATTLRAASVRGDSARYRGEPRRDALIVTRFGEGEEGLLLAVIGSPGRLPTTGASDAARQLAAAIGRSRTELAADLRAGARDRLRYGLQRLTAQAAAPLRAANPTSSPDSPSLEAPSPEEPSPDPSRTDIGSLHCLLISLDPAATHRVAFGLGPGGLYLLRSGHWIDAYGARLLHHPAGRPPAPPAAAPTHRPFRFRLVPVTSGDILLLCTPGLGDPIADEPAVAHFLSNHWAHPHPPGTVDFLRQVQVRAKGYADDRTAVGLWTE